MSQATKLGKVKKIKLSEEHMKPPTGFKPVGFTESGKVIYEGYVFAGNPYFQDHKDGVPSDSGHERRPVMDPDTEKQAYRRNKATGQAITPIFQARRGQKLVRGVMIDHGNGNAGLRPIPQEDPEVKRRLENERAFEQFQRELSAAAAAEGLSAVDLVRSLKAQMDGSPKNGSSKPPEPSETFPAWSGPAKGWRLSDGTYVERNEGEDKDDYKARAEAAQAALET